MNRFWITLLLLVGMVQSSSENCWTVKREKDSVQVCDPYIVNASNPDLGFNSKFNLTWVLISDKFEEKITTLVTRYSNWHKTPGLHLQIYDENGTDYSKDNFPLITYSNLDLSTSFGSYIFMRSPAQRQFLCIWTDNGKEIGDVKGSLDYGDYYEVGPTGHASIKQSGKDGLYTFFRFELEKDIPTQDFVAYVQSHLSCDDKQNLLYQWIYTSTCHENSVCSYPKNIQILPTIEKTDEDGNLKIGFPQVTLGPKKETTYLLVTIAHQISGGPKDYCSTRLDAYISPYLHYELNYLRASETESTAAYSRRYVPVKVDLSKPSNISVEFTSNLENSDSLFTLFFNPELNISSQNSIQADYSISQSNATSNFAATLDCPEGKLFFSIYNAGKESGEFKLRISAGKTYFWYIVFGAVAAGLVVIFLVVGLCMSRKSESSEYEVIN